jgi:perosamine synthetase
MLLPIFKPYIRRADMDSVLSCLISDEIGSGDISKELIIELGEFLNLTNGYLFRDYYRAISIALDLLELKSGSRVLLSPLSPGVYIDVFRDKGIIPIFVDVDSETALMDHSKL